MPWAWQAVRTCGHKQVERNNFVQANGKKGNVKEMANRTSARLKKIKRHKHLLAKEKVHDGLAGGGAVIRRLVSF